MRCPTCGRELRDGTMFCQCGATVGYSGTDDLNLYPEKKKGALPLLIGMAVGALIFVIVIIAIASAATQGKRNITDRTKWEHISGSGFSMTIPGGMKDGDVIDASSGLTVVKELRSSEVGIVVGSIPYDSKSLGSINRKKLQEMIKKNMPAKDSMGHEIDIKERGSMFYYDYVQNQSGVFFGTDELHVVNAITVGKSAVYDLIIVCPEKKYYTYESFIFSWIDSFQGE